MLLEDFQDLDIALNEDQIETFGHQIEGECFAGLVTRAIDHSIRFLTVFSDDVLRWSGRWSLLCSTGAWLLWLSTRWIFVREWLEVLLAVEEAPKPA